MIRKLSRILSLALLLGVPAVVTMAGPSSHRTTTASPKPKKPKLVVGIVVDQMRFDYLQRFWANFGEGGFKRLVGEGTSFSNCNFNYVPTETAPGHASIFTGTTPSNHGIVMNQWLDPATIDKGKIFPHSSVYDSLHPYVGVHPLRTLKRGVSPLLLEATTIADQIKAATKGQAITVGVSLKDRSAILPVGKTANAAYFFDALTGNMISSNYYPSSKTTLPAWVDSINALRQPLQYLANPDGWQLLIDAARYTTQDGPGDGRYEGTYILEDQPYFPHYFKLDSLNSCADFMTTAWGNQFLKDFAKQAVVHHRLGADGVTDFLSLSFSSTDMVAHQFGIESREVEDTYLRLDQDLADFMRFLDGRIGKENLLVFLTADHGGSPNPNYAVDHGGQGGWLDDEALKAKLRAQLGDQAGRDSLLIAVQGHHIYLNHRLAAARKLDLDSLHKVVAGVANTHPGILKAYTAKEIATMQPANEGERLLKNGYYASRSGDVLYLESYGYFQPPYDPRETWRHKKGTSHGSHHEYDTHVPLLFWGGKVPVQQSDVAVTIPDIAASVCKLLGVKPTSKCSGKPIGVLVE